MVNTVANADQLESLPPVPAEVAAVLDRGDSLLADGAEPILSGPARDDASVQIGDPLSVDGSVQAASFTVTTQKQPEYHYSIEARVPTASGVRKGDVVMAAWWMRATGSSLESREALTLFRLQRVVSPWERTVYGQAVAGPKWKLFYRAGRVGADIPADQLAAVFSAGYPKQGFEIKGLRVVNLGPDADPSDLPQMRYRYEGDEPDAAWRLAAAERIDRLRKADLSVTVVDAQGNPLPDATVHVQQTRHAFEFGSAISADWLVENWDTLDGQAYREKIGELFNSVALANQLKWARWEKSPEPALRTLRWLRSEGMKTHGHVLIWPGLQKFRVQDRDAVWAAAQDDPDVLRRRIDNHFVDILSQTAGLIDHWDVVNEPFTQHEMLDLLGRDEMVHWFELARKHAPDAGLFLNDFGILAGSGVDFEKQQFMIDTVRFLLDRGAPITAIGFQSHMGQGLTPPTRVLGILDRFAELGLPVMITEYDVTVPDDEAQERYTRDFMTAVFSHPSIKGFTVWGFWEPVMWAGRSAMYDRDWNLMPVGRAYRALVLEEWTTDQTLQTDRAGRVALRGFKGDYTIRVDPGQGQPSHVAAITLGPDGAEVTVDLATGRVSTSR